MLLVPSCGPLDPSVLPWGANTDSIHYSGAGPFLYENATYSCSHGTEPSGLTQFLCYQNDGQISWISRGGACVGPTSEPTIDPQTVNCGIPSNLPEHMTLYQDGRSHTTYLGDMALLECEQGFTATSDMFIKCQADGTWSKPTGPCESLGRSLAADFCRRFSDSAYRYCH